jgi:hypothetical protein
MGVAQCVARSGKSLWLCGCRYGGHLCLAAILHRMSRSLHAASARHNIIRFLTMHIALIHKMLSSIHNAQVSSMVSLLYLSRKEETYPEESRGHSRVQPPTAVQRHHHMFSIVFFRFRTFAGYYFLFTALQLGVVMCQAVLWSVSICRNEFPWYELYKALLDTGFMSAGHTPSASSSFFFFKQKFSVFRFGVTIHRRSRRRISRGSRI